MAILLPLALAAQQPLPRSVIFLDPAHGGPDTGAHLPNNLLEKDLILASNGFTMVSTREIDPTVTFTTDQRAEIANRAHPIACLIVHATDSGSGVHVVTSALAPDNFEELHAPIPWNTAQAASVSQSLSLANEIGLALQHAKLPVILTRASVRPLDNVTCPAVAIEIAPLAPAGSDPTPISDAAYQQNIAQALVAALVSWRNHANPAAGAAK